MRPLVYVLPAVLLLAVASEAQAAPTLSASSTECNPAWGPFDPCLWMCGPEGSLQCNVLWGTLIIGGSVWDCATNGNC